MAEHIVSFVLTKLKDLAVKEYLFLREVSGEIKSVEIQLEQMHALLRDAEERKNKGDHGTEVWLKQVRDVAFDIENAIDMYAIKIHIVKEKLVPFFERDFTKIAALHKLGKEISVIQKNIRTISDSANNLGIRRLVNSIAVETTPFRNPEVPDIDDEEIVGFEVDKKNIINALVDGANTQMRRVVSLVGPGGLGKSTLAQKVFNNTEVKEYFHPRIWLTISQNFKQNDVIKQLYEEVTGDKRNEVEETRVYLSKLNNHLRAKRYLIVLDDVWSENVMQSLKVGLPDVRKESRVMITTRSRSVAELADFNSVFELPFLSEDDSFILLLNNALRIPDPLVNCPDELRDVATTLANRCSGLPLAIVVLGRLLSTKRHAQWSQVDKNLDWYRDGKMCIDVLASSYHHLPCYLKSCFRYLACFPEDCVIYAESLLRMWIAEGFMDHIKNGTLEEEAERCLDELAQRSLVQVVKRNLDGSIKFIRIHDLLRDLAIRESKENDYLLTYPTNTQTDLKRVHRVVVHSNHEASSQNENLENLPMPNIRSLLNFDVEIQIGIRYPLLRVLELKNNWNLKKLPEELKSMIHLRYLGLEHTGLEQLPETIGCLQNLQTINIAVTKVEKIPSSLWGIQALRHVTLNEACPGPPPLANLVNLQTLEAVCVPESWRDGLPHLPSLRNLGIQYSDREENGSIVVPDWDRVIALLGTLSNLVLLEIRGESIPVEIFDVKTLPSYQNLQDLSLYLPHGSEPSYSTRFFLDTFEMPQKLITLWLSDVSFDKDPMPKLENLPCLKSLSLSNIENVEEMVCSTKGFPQLQKLFIDDVHDLKHWKVEKEAMPVLKTLEIYDCEKLSALPELNHVKTLQQLELRGMSDVIKSKLEDRTGEEWQKIQHVPTIEIDNKLVPRTTTN